MNKLLLLITLCLAGCADSALLPWNNPMTAGAFPNSMRGQGPQYVPVPVYVGGNSGDSETAQAIREQTFYQTLNSF